MIKIDITNNECTLMGALNFDTTPVALDLIKKKLKKIFKNKLSDNTPNGIPGDLQNTFILNLSQITHSDSSALAFLTELMRELEKKNFILKIKNMPKKLFDLASLSGLNAVLPLE